MPNCLTVVRPPIMLCAESASGVESMNDSNTRLFESKRIRTVWAEEKQDWYFSLVDVVGALTDSPNPTDYLKNCTNEMS